MPLRLTQGSYNTARAKKINSRRAMESRISTVVLPRFTCPNGNTAHRGFSPEHGRQYDRNIRMAGNALLMASDWKTSI